MRRWWVGVLVAAMVTSVQAKDRLRFALGETWAMPFALVDKGRLSGGILYELMLRVAHHAGAEPQFVLLPNKRVDAALAEGAVDLHCLLSPKWFPAPGPAAERWSVPLLHMDDQLLAAPGGLADGFDLSSARGQSVGVVLGYRYPMLEPLFASRQLVREEAVSQQQVLEKLARSRSDFGVANNFVAAWFNSQRPPEQRLQVVRTLEGYDTHCLLSERPRLQAQRILSAVRKVVDQGELKAILARYR